MYLLDFALLQAIHIDVNAIWEALVSCRVSNRAPTGPIYLHSACLKSRTPSWKDLYFDGNDWDWVNGVAKKFVENSLVVVGA
jgi:hypothetical protein